MSGSSEISAPAEATARSLAIAVACPDDPGISDKLSNRPARAGASGRQVFQATLRASGLAAMCTGLFACGEPAIDPAATAKAGMIERCEASVKAGLKAPSTYRRISAELGIPDAAEKKLYVILHYDAANDYNTPIRQSELCEFPYGPAEQKIFPTDKHEQEVWTNRKRELDALGTAPTPSSCCMPPDISFTRSKEERTPWQSASRPEQSVRASDCEGTYVGQAGQLRAKERPLSIQVQPSKVVVRHPDGETETADRKTLLDGSLEFRAPGQPISRLTCVGSTALVVMPPRKGQSEAMFVLEKSAPGIRAIAGH